MLTAAASTTAALASSAVGTAASAGEAPAPSRPSTASTLPLVQARPADGLVDSVGVRTTMYRANSSLYGDVDLVLDALRADNVGLGVRHIREEIILPRTNATMAANQRRAWQRLRAIGIDVTCLLGDPDNSDGTVAQFADYIRTSLGGNSGMVRAVENSNEPNAPDKAWNRANPAGWVRLCRARQAQMASQFRSSSDLDRILLAGPSVSGGAGLLKYELLGDLSPNVDLGNFHYYVGNRQQHVPGADMDAIMQGIAINAPRKPVYCTETGMHQGRGTAMASFPERVAALYIPRLVLEHLYHGVSKAFIFELLDDHPDPLFKDQEAHFGLLRYNTRQLEPKPAYRSLKRLLDLLRDPGAQFSPGQLAMEVTGAPRDYRQLLFEKSNGRRYLCMWRAVRIWNETMGSAVKAGPVNVTLNLAEPARINVYRPARKTPPDSAYTGVTSLTLGLGGGVKVLEIY